MGYKEDLEANLNAIRRAKYLIDNKIKPSDNDIKIINSFVSWGNFKELLYPYNLDWQFLTTVKTTLSRENSTKSFINELQEIFPEDFERIFENIKSSISTSFYTDPNLVKSLFSRIDENSEINSFLDPCVGGGVFIDEFITRYPTVPKANIYAIDIDTIATLLIKAKHPDINVINIGFEKFISPIKFDLISSNIPFGNDKIYDPTIKIANATERIHNYFLYKSNELLADNGILQLISTGGLINTRANSEVLSYVEKDVSISALVPLSTDAFKGTEVNAYYIEAQKDGNPKKTFFSTFIVTEDQIILNSAIKKDDFNLYIHKNPYGKPEYAVNGNNAETINYLDNLPKLLYKSIFSGIERIAEFYIGIELIGQISKDNFNNKYLIKQNNNDKIWLTGKEFKQEIHQFYNTLLYTSKEKKENIKIISNNDGFIKYFDDTYLKKFANEIKLITESQSINIKNSIYSNANIIQGELVKIDDKFYKLNGEKLEKIEEFDPALYNSYYSLKSSYKKYLSDPTNELFKNILKENYDYILENNFDTRLEGIDTFGFFFKTLNSNVFSKNHEIQLTSKESLYKVLNYHDAFTLQDIQQHCNLSTDEVLAELNELIIFNPLLNKYQQKEYFLSGNLFQLVDKISLLDGNFDEILAEIKSNFPERIHYPEIKIQFGTRWIVQKHIVDFINKKFNCEFAFNYDPKTDFLVVNPLTYSEMYRNQGFITLGNRYIHAEDIILNAFYHTYPIVTYSEMVDGTRVTYTDKESTELFKRRIDGLRNSFSEYMATISSEDKLEIEEYYNKTRNFKSYKPNGDHLTFDDIDLAAVGIKEINSHQKNAIWKNVMNGGGLIDHEVGLGKTLTMILEAHLLKKVGKVAKPMIIGLPANYGDIKREFEKIVPNAKILFLDNDKNFSTSNRQATLLSIATEDWDVVIASHSQYKMLKMPTDKEIGYIESAIDNCKNNLFNIKNEFGNSDVSKKQLFGLEKKIKTLESRLTIKLDNIRKNSEDNIITFDQMGIDHIIVDESHQFKNLDLETRHERVAGLSSQGSERSLNLLIGAEVIREKRNLENYGISLYSGTPIANQLAECYTLKKYMIPGVLKDMNISNFDSWASNFIIKATEYEVNTVGNIVSKERFRYYINVPDLAAIYGSFTDIMTGEIAKIDRPKANEKLIVTPELSSQRRFMKKLERFLNTGDSSKLGLEKPLNIDSASSAKSIVAMNLAFKASLDMRLINSSYKDDPKSKINELVRNIVEHYTKNNDIRSTQIAFIDTSTPKQSFTEKRILEQVENNTFTNVYDDIAGKLLKAGIKPDEIAYIHDYNTAKKKETLNKKMNAGDIRILLGSTEKAGTGLNVQKRLMKVYNVTIPWRPSDLKQRVGRIERQGNEYSKLYNDNKADVITLATEKTFDNLKINTVANKAKFINQLKEATINKNIEREIDEGAMDENTGLTLAEFQAQISGDTTLLDYTKVQKSIEDILKQKKEIENNQAVIRAKIENSIKEISSRQKAIDIINSLLHDNIYDDTLHYLEVKEPSDKTLKQYYEQIESDNAIPNVETEIAEYKGFKMFHKYVKTLNNTDLFGDNFHQYVVKKDNFSYMISDGSRNGASINHFQNIINSLERRNEKNNEQCEKEKLRLSELKEIPVPSWDKTKELLLNDLALQKQILESKISERQEYLKSLDPKVIEGYRTIETTDQLKYTIENDLLGIPNQTEIFNVTSEVYDVMNAISSAEIGFDSFAIGMSETGIYKSTSVIISDYDILNSEINYDVFRAKEQSNEIKM